MCDKINSTLKPEIEKLHTEINSLTAEIKQKDDTIEELKTVITDLENRVEDLEQYSRRNAVVLSSVNDSLHENTDLIMLDRCSKVLNVNLQPEEISRSHRLPGGPPRIDYHIKPRPIVVKFATYNIRKRIYDARKNIKITKNNNEKLYTNEHLTKHRARLFYLTRNKVKSKALMNAWTSDGRVLVRDLNNTTLLITKESQLEIFQHESTEQVVNIGTQQSAVN